MEVTTKDLRLHARELLSATDRGEEVIITWRGRRRAKLTHLSEQPERPLQARNPAFGLWSDSTSDVDAEVRRLRQRRKLP